jgi:hypothetical protein
MDPDVADRRLAIMQCVLRYASVVPGSAPAGSAAPTGAAPVRSVRLAFGEQQVEVAVSTVRARDRRWYVAFIDLAPIASYCG